MLSAPSACFKHGSHVWISATGQIRQKKWCEFLYKKYISLDIQTRKTKLSSQLINLFGAQPLLNPLHKTFSTWGLNMYSTKNLNHLGFINVFLLVTSVWPRTTCWYCFNGIPFMGVITAFHQFLIYSPYLFLWNYKQFTLDGDDFAVSGYRP